MDIAVVDLGIGNLHSVEQALMHVAPDARVQLSFDADVIHRADRIVLPGQGAIGSWFDALEQRELVDVIRESIDTKPLLGICVGMQALFGFCEEDGGCTGLGLFDGSVRHFSNFHGASCSTVSKSGSRAGQIQADKLASESARLKIPQMGWNQVSQIQDHPLWDGIENNSYFYFVHSYCANLNDEALPNVVFGSADYGHHFIAAAGQDNIFAVQFHPEKSHTDGLQLLNNFTRWDGSL